MAITAPRTKAEIRDSIRRRVKGDSSDTFLLDTIDGFVSQRYAKLCSETSWRWLKDYRDILVPAEYTTGTVTVVAESREVTGLGTTWNADFVGRWMEIQGDDTVYKIVGRNSATVVQLSERVDRASAATLTYRIYQAEFGLWPDCDHVDEIWHDHLSRRHTVRAVTPDEYADLVSIDPDNSGKAQLFTRLGNKNYEGDPVGQDIIGYSFIGTPLGPGLAVYPRRPDERYVLHVSYIRKVDFLSADTDQPLIPENDRWVLVEGGLSDTYAMLGNETATAYWNKEYEKSVARMRRDNEETDNTARFIVPDKWRRSRPSTAEYDMGTWFDRDIQFR